MQSSTPPQAAVEEAVLEAEADHERGESTGDMLEAKDERIAATDATLAKKKRKESHKWKAAAQSASETAASVAEERGELLQAEKYGGKAELTGPKLKAGDATDGAKMILRRAKHRLEGLHSAHDGSTADDGDGGVVSTSGSRSRSSYGTSLSMRNLDMEDEPGTRQGVHDNVDTNGMQGVHAKGKGRDAGREARREERTARRHERDVKKAKRRGKKASNVMIKEQIKLESALKMVSEHAIELESKRRTAEEARFKSNRSAERHGPEHALTISLYKASLEAILAVENHIAIYKRAAEEHLGVMEAAAGAAAAASRCREISDACRIPDGYEAGKEVDDLFIAHMSIYGNNH